MREYKFRGRSIEPLVGDDQWLYGFGVHVVELADGGKEYWLYTYHGTYQVDPETVGQYTGIQDRNENDIYEGDVFIPSYRTHSDVTIVCYDLKKARYKAVPLRLYKANAGNGGWTGFDLDQFGEVIGNIYENPSLLEVTHES